VLHRTNAHRNLTLPSTARGQRVVSAGVVSANEKT